MVPLQDFDRAAKRQRWSLALGLAGNATAANGRRRGMTYLPNSIFWIFLLLLSTLPWWRHAWSARMHSTPLW